MIYVYLYNKIDNKCNHSYKYEKCFFNSNTHFLYNTCCKNRYSLKFLKTNFYTNIAHLILLPYETNS